IVTDRPTEIAYRIIPYASPWKATLTRLETNASIKQSPRRAGAFAFRCYREEIFFKKRLLFPVYFFPGIFHGLDRFAVHLDVGEHAADLAHLADVLVLDDVARFRVDRDRAARAVRVLPGLQDRHGLVGIEL